MESAQKSITLKIGWILLLLLGLYLILGALGSLAVAYTSVEEDQLGSLRVSELAKVSPSAAAAVRGRRATSASLSFACGVMVCWIAATAYRRREKWAWYALLTSVGIGSALSIFRISMIGITQGAGIAGIMLAVLLAALLISYRDFGVRPRQTTE
jgi:hypothetical protein